MAMSRRYKWPSDLEGNSVRLMKIFGEGVRTSTDRSAGGKSNLRGRRLKTFEEVQFRSLGQELEPLLKFPHAKTFGGLSRPFTTDLSKKCEL